MRVVVHRIDLQGLRELAPRTVVAAGVAQGARKGLANGALLGLDELRTVEQHGRLDIMFEPAGTTGYEDLARDAVRLTILGIDVDVASLADVIRSKEAAAREKDRLVLPVLRRIAEAAEG